MTPAGEYADMFHFDGARTDTIEWYDVNRTGTFRVQADEAYDQAHELVPQNSTSMSVRFASRTAVTSTRSGSTVSVTATTSRYAWSASAFRPWAGAKATLESRKCSTCAWTGQDRHDEHEGVVTLTAYASTARSWRVVTADTPRRGARCRARRPAEPRRRGGHLPSPSPCRSTAQAVRPSCDSISSSVG
ncbi:hypothetical protein [Janibacter melonis]|uniref:hypothetical protein n=1 Tax=Janibacter melonis TaxID=262209 RepID=UPI0020951FD6|nr:hypothetical protein [Janibacter melonis]